MAEESDRWSCFKVSVVDSPRAIRTAMLLLMGGIPALTRLKPRANARVGFCFKINMMILIKVRSRLSLWSTWALDDYDRFGPAHRSMGETPLYTLISTTRFSTWMAKCSWNSGNESRMQPVAYPCRGLRNFDQTRTSPCLPCIITSHDIAVQERGQIPQPRADHLGVVGVWCWNVLTVPADRSLGILQGVFVGVVG